MDPSTTARSRRPLAAKAPASGPPVQAPRLSRATVLPSDELTDRLGSLTDREDLERLFARHVSVSTLVQLSGRQIPRERILDLLESPNLEEDLRKILG